MGHVSNGVFPVSRIEDRINGMRKFFVSFWEYIAPVPLTVVMYFIWLHWYASQAFALYVILLPLVYGYIVPGIGTNILKKWRFKGPMLVGNYYIHHGFKYSASMSLLLFIVFLGTPRSSLTAETVVRIALCAAALEGFVDWIHEILLVKFGLVEIYNRPAAEGRSPEEIVTYYAPLTFFLLGLTYAASCLLAFEVFAVRNVVTPISVLGLSLAGGTMMSLIPSLAYRFLEKKQPVAGRD